MQTCSKCNASSPDDAKSCFACQADLSVYSTRAVALRNLCDNPRVRSIRISVAEDACPECTHLLNSYPKNRVPLLPHPGCSHANGCRCFYEPVLEETALIGKVVGQ